MRDRRGNYMIMFAFLLPILVGFMAFSIDLGRLRVAKIEAEAAADAAALAALMEIRDGGTRGTALIAATEVANLNHLQAQMHGEGTSAFSQWQVEIDWGDWDWQGGGSWQANNGATGAVTVNLTQQGEGIGMLFAPIFENSGWYGAGTSSGNQNDSHENHTLEVGKRAAMRPRDIVLAVDISLDGLAQTNGINTLKSKLGGFVDSVDDHQLEDNRMGIVYYAGIAEEVQSIQTVSDNFSSLRSAATGVEPCSVDQDAWYYFWRHYNLSSIPDPELDGLGYDYAYVDALGTPNISIHSEEFQLLQFFLSGGGTTETDFDTMTDAEFDNLVLSDAQICGFWQVSQFQFEQGDPRRKRHRALGLGSGSLGTMACHQGHYLEDDADRFDNLPGNTVLGMNCPNGAGDVPNIPNTTDDAGNPVPQYGGPLSVGSDQKADFSYTQAGSRPGRALSKATDMLLAAGDTFRERTIVLVAGTGYRCPPTLDGTRRAACESQLEDEAFTQASILETLGVNTHVIGVVPGGTDDEFFLSGLTTGRGKYHPLNDLDELDVALTDIARNVRLQVVQ